MRYDSQYSKPQRKQMAIDKMKASMSGSGLFLYENNTNADITLPRPTKSGRRQIGPREQFQGDDYYMSLMKTGLIRLIKVIQTPEQEKQALLQQEALMSQQNEKLILDQPETITEHGKVEHVAAAHPHLGQPVKKKLNEVGSSPKAQPDVLINESPCDGGFVIVED